MEVFASPRLLSGRTLGKLLTKGLENNPGFFEATRKFQERSVWARAVCDKPSRRNRGQLLHEMKEAEGAEAGFAKQADWHPKRAKPVRWYPERWPSIH
jgi:hypothetical protein